VDRARETIFNLNGPRWRARIGESCCEDVSSSNLVDLLEMAQGSPRGWELLTRSPGARHHKKGATDSAVETVQREQLKGTGESHATDTHRAALEVPLLLSMF
jgi:hypothetical protein